MFILKLIRFIYGYVFFEGKSKSPEKLVNMVSRYGLNIWDMRVSNGTIRGCIAKSNYHLLRSIVYKSRVKMKIKKKCGLPFKIARYKKRSGFILGSVMFLIILYTMSLFVWSIEVRGNVYTDTKAILSVVSELGVHPGALRSSIDAKLIEQAAMSRISDISWMSINMLGSVVQIEINEREKPPEISPNEGRSNLIASTAGQITRLEIYSGTNMVKAGDVVLPGQMLVSGIVEDSFGNTTIKKSEGKIYAKLRRYLEEEVVFSQEIKVPEGKPVIRKQIRIFGMNIPMNLISVPYSDCTLEITETKNNLFGTRLPVVLYIEKFTPITKKIESLTQEEALSRAQENLQNREATEFKDSKILDKLINTEVCENSLKLKASYLCEENIALESPIEVTE